MSVVKLLLLLSGSTFLLIAAEGSAFEKPDPPSRVARMSYLQGAVSVRPAGVDAWTSAELNRPLTTGDAVWTDERARAELHTSAAALRLDSRTNIAVLNLDDRITQVKLTDGVIGIHLMNLDEAETFEIDTPSVAITLLRPGKYRLEAHAEETLVIVLAGESEVATPDQAFTVRARQEARIEGLESPHYEITQARASDAFDQFCESRDQREERGEASKYVSREVVGYEDLDEHGIWRTDPEWGPVWVPRVAIGWAPYRYGHWIWLEPWGWTWVDDAPWGFAPFHYGRWVIAGGVWVWIPGPIRIRPVWSPALVVFAGGGGPGFRFHFWIGVGGGVAWFPLGPGEIYLPPYRASRVYINNINISNTIVRDNTRIYETKIEKQRYINRTAPGAMTAVDRETFTSGRSFGSRAVVIGERDALASRISGAAPPVAPRRESLAPSPGAPRPSDRQVNRRVVVRQTPPPSAAPFSERQWSLESSPGVPPDRHGNANRSAPDIRVAAPPSRPAPQLSTPSTPPIDRGEADGKREQRTEHQAEKRNRAIQSERRREEHMQKEPRGGADGRGDSGRKNR